MNSVKISCVNEDERAAGIISASSDPYREMQLYLEQVNKEIGEVFEEWATQPLNKTTQRVQINESSPPDKPETQILPLSKRCASSLLDRNQNGDLDKCITEWSESFFSEFNSVLEDELQSLKDLKSKREDSDYDEVADTSDEETDNMKYKVLRRTKATYKTSSDNSSDSSGSKLNNICRIIRNKHRTSTVSDEPILINVRIFTDTAIPSADNTNCVQKTAIDSQWVPKVNVETQTSSPSGSRSSCFTWHSDYCSEDDRSSSSSCSDGSRLSGESATTREEPDSAVGTCSPPTKGRILKAFDGSRQKCRRKESRESIKKGNSLRSSKKNELNENRMRTPIIVNITDSSSDTEMPSNAKRPECLTLATSSISGKSSQETLPSPGCTSLKVVNDNMLPELGGKSSSAPILMKYLNPPVNCSIHTNQENKNQVIRQARSHSEKHLTEIEAQEACNWLKAAGFPQYAQMYQDMRFPIDVNAVQKDHPFLQLDALQSLFRRLHSLNRCANMKLNYIRTKPTDDDSDSDTECALSDHWLFQPELRRWSRIQDMPITQQSYDSVEYTNGNDNDNGGLIDNYEITSSLPPSGNENNTNTFRRTSSERIRDGAKALLRRVESLKSRKRKQKNREGISIGSPQVIDLSSMEMRMRQLNCVDVTPPSSPSFLTSHSNKKILERRNSEKVKYDLNALSDSEIWERQRYMNDDVDKNRNHTTISCAKSAQSSPIEHCRNHNNNYFTFKTDSENGDHLDGISSKSKASVVRWHNLQQSPIRPDSLTGQDISTLTVGQISILRKLALLKLTGIMEKYCPGHKATAWGWELPRFIRKAKLPEYKDKNVFGVPLLVNVQRTGLPLPCCITSALTWMENHAFDQVGLFRKPGVRSRIHKLRVSVESNGHEQLELDSQQAYDVADMVKQYFRELPDALLTSKLSETFVAILQHVPENMKTEALRCALTLLPDEHREALHILLDFLQTIARKSYINQMTPSNLAVCMAPSLFHWSNNSQAAHTRRSLSASPKRIKKSSGVPDAKELGQTKAAHECIEFLIKHHKELLKVSQDLLEECFFNSMDESIPVSLEELGDDLQQDWKGYLDICTNALLKEVKDKSRGWVNIGCWDDVEVSYKKVHDGHPLRIWKVSTEVEAPPQELLYRILRERHVWDESLLTCRVIHRLDTNAELLQYLVGSIKPLPLKDYCVVRSWKGDLTRGRCVIVETSVEHSDAPIATGGVRGIVLASRYLIEPCGMGKCRVLHLSRVDTRGRCSEWYNKCYGRICAQYLTKIRNSFQKRTDGPESKV